MGKIEQIDAREILDSRGYPTIEVSVRTESGVEGRASVPSGASTGKREALELRDLDQDRFSGKGVKRAIQNVVGPLNRLLKGVSLFDQVKVDALMIGEDDTANKSALGANAILGVSLAVARAGARARKVPLYRYIGGIHTAVLPIPMINIINGGAHADNSIAFQEFMIRPHGAPSFSEAIRWGAEVFHALKSELNRRSLATSVGDEGGFAPNLDSDDEVLAVIAKAVELAGYRLGDDITLAMDCAASDFYDPVKELYLGERSHADQVSYLHTLCEKYPIDSIEDGLAEDDWEGWKLLTARLGDRVQIVGDDLFVTQVKLLKEGIKDGVANAILIKPNQVGTLTETLEAVEVARAHEYETIISHRSGETGDTFIADLCVGTRSQQIKTGSLSRSERVEKYNRLLSIERELGSRAIYGVAH